MNAAIDTLKAEDIFYRIIVSLYGTLIPKSAENPEDKDKIITSEYCTLLDTLSSATKLLIQRLSSSSSRICTL